jgi:aminopeptidase-like protein
LIDEARPRIWAASFRPVFPMRKPFDNPIHELMLEENTMPPESNWTDPRQSTGEDIYRFMSELYPLCRSITGDAARETLRLIGKRIPLKIHEVPSGTAVFDWVVPKEWNIKDAYIKNSQGERVVDFQKSNLHVVSYSIPVHRKVSLGELKNHLFALPEHPDWIPYRTSYYKEDWGFCVAHNQLLALNDDEYEVCIDATLEPGHLSYGESYLKGQTEDEVLITTHICHPSLCNDNLSGIAVTTHLAKLLLGFQLRYSYRFLFIPATIGSITWLWQNESKVPNIKHGLVVTLLGDAGKTTYKKSRRGTAAIDRAAAHALKHSGTDYSIVEFHPYGYDERQFCSPGFNLPVGCLMRTPNGCFPEYHTSADDLSFVQPEYLADSFSKCVSILNILENNRTYLNKNPKCEPQLGKRGLYQVIGGAGDGGVDILALLWVLNLSDGKHNLLEIAEKSNLNFVTIKTSADVLLRADLLEATE